MHKVWAVVGAAVALALGTGAVQAADAKACFVYVGPHNDGGWSEGHDVGRQMVEEELGDKVETAYIENVPEGPDSVRAIERMARSGCDIVFTTSFGYMEPTLEVAAKFPNVKFEHATGYLTADNVTTYNARFYQGRYIIGQIAAKMSKAGVAGYIGAVPIPEVVMGINAFMLGAQSVNPDFKIKIIWVNDWFDPGAEADAAKSLFDQGVDVIAQHTDSPAPLQIAQERGLHGFGQSHDMYDFAPEAQYTAITDHWGPYYVRRVQAVLDGTWTSEASWDGIAEGLVVMAPYHNLPDDVVADAKAAEAAIASGELHPFKGPVYNQAGEEIVAEGEHLTDDVLLGMDWYVQGIDGEVPK